MFDHIGISVANLEASKAFFIGALAPLNVDVVMEFPDALGSGSDGKPSIPMATTSRRCATMPKRER